MKYTHLLFDLDGTLADASSGLSRAMADTLKNYGGSPYADDYVKYIGPPFYDILAGELGFPEAMARRIHKEFRTLFVTDDYFNDARLLDGVIDGLDKLKEAGYTLSIATCRPTVYAKRLLEQLNIAHYFSVIGGLSLDKNGGEKADAISTVFAKYPDAPKSAFVMIGDRYQDMEGAKKTGIDAIGVRTGFALENELESFSPVFIAQNFEELTSYLL